MQGGATSGEGGPGQRGRITSFRGEKEGGRKESKRLSAKKKHPSGTFQHQQREGKGLLFKCTQGRLALEGDGPTIRQSQSKGDHHGLKKSREQHPVCSIHMGGRKKDRSNNNIEKKCRSFITEQRTLQYTKKSVATVGNQGGRWRQTTTEVSKNQIPRLRLQRGGEVRQNGIGPRKGARHPVELGQR